MKKLFSLLLLLIMPAMVHAQASVHGTVVDQQTGTPIVGASVVITGTTVGAITNDAGGFNISTDRSVTSLTVTSPGYAAAEIPVTDASVALRIRLAPSQTRLPGVQIVANKPTPSTAILTQQDLDRASGLSLENSINTVPGIFMQSRTPWGGARITIRGYYPSTSGNSPNSNGLGYNVFLNDIPVTDASGATILDDIDYSTLGNVEVIKGPASSQYGSQIGGTVRFTTARPTPNETSLSQQLTSGSYGLLRSNTSFQTATNSSDLVLNYGHQTYDSFRPHSGSLKDYLSATGDYTVSDNQTLSAYFAYNRSFEELAGEIDSADFYARRPVSNAAYLANDSHIQITSFITGLTDNYRLTDDITNKTTVFGTGRTYGQPFAHGFTDANQFTFGARSAFGYSGQWGVVDVTGTLGGMLERTNISTNGVFIVPAPPYPQRPTSQENYASIASLFTEWNFAMPSQFTLTVGASLNKNEFGIRNMLRNGQVFDSATTQVRSFDAVIAPRVALTRGFGSNASVYASVSSGYTPPLLSNTIDNTGAVDLSLKPERAVQYEVGAQGSLFANRLNGQVSLFDIENSDKLVSQTANSITYTTNAGKQRDRGAEASLSYLVIDNPTQLVSLVRPWASYTYNDSRFIDFKSDNNNTAATVDFSDRAVPRVPRNMFNGGLDLTSNQGIYLNSTYQYVDKVPVTFDNSTYVKSYDLLGAKIGYKTKMDRHWSLDASLGGDNLLGSTYYSFLFVGPNYAGLAQAPDGGHGDGYIIPGPYKATVYGNLTLRYTF
ncbi:MAG TPA: TonB-dependent receptor plug domain-containing protein [Gemmatimonadaceae bacterium]|nr:TonB-dependent receptor plug domain-containing protein [Gemmatimonadaceae bacterium]